MVLIILLGLAIVITSASSSSAQSTKARLTAIEKQLNAIQRKVFKPGSRFQSGTDNDNNSPVESFDGGQGALIGDINIKISELETQIRMLTGQLEEAIYKVDTMTHRLESMEKDNELRFSALEKGRFVTSTDANSMGATMPSASSSTPVVKGSVKQQYDYAYSLISSGKYTEAELKLLEFLKDHPKDALSGNAQYWLGQTYYARENYSEATRIFLQGMSKYPESSKAPAFLLKVGMSLNFLGEKQEACEVYRELDARFPDSTENKRMRPTEERKAGCS